MASLAEPAACKRVLKLISVLVRPCASKLCMPLTADPTAAAFCSVKLLSMAFTSANSLACGHKGCSSGAELIHAASHFPEGSLSYTCSMCMSCGM